MIRKISKLFFQGLMAVLPIIVTAYILYWLASTAESVLGSMIKLVLPSEYYIPGMGVAAGVGVVFAAGALLRLWLFRRLFRWGERLLQRLPLIKSIYGAISSLMDFLDSSKKKDFNRVVLVNFHKEVKMIGLVTREDFEGLPCELGMDDKVAVLLPWSYQMGGITIVVSRSRLEPLEMDVNVALKFMLTGGVNTSKQQ
ncbi:hypothetical protein SMSP2_01615 [Limihaloglobus sulfuriphilus]|uniref:DUF502 domain-containing protein n=1 Tax=Limihaloglobus sulfuriphilus TaxID=1851148 RepID=A0A1Q2MF13_9BACT|nr:DUF502 domain-containing protein [Limihaloglobus sulfuriphilus]AQQ71249.1 hypothetical protein SMSP2_01615 [Limihaloglobus sulfuriphilus]